MGIDFSEHLAEDRRLCILRLLKDVHGTANDSVIMTALERLGHNRLPRETVRKDIRVLIDNGLVIDEWIGDILVAKITRRGVEVAEGRIQVAGIKQPRIGE